MMNVFLSNITAILSIIISIATSIYTVIRDHRNDKRLEQTEKINKENQKWKKDFDLFKEDNRQKYLLIQNLLSRQQTRASIIPYFNIVLKDNRIRRDKNSLILEIGLINIGKESATNIQLSPYSSNENKLVYFKNKQEFKWQYYINEYLSQYYAFPGDEVTYKISVDLNDKEKINDFLEFKIKYSDLIGNVYEQGFKFGIHSTYQSGLEKIFYNHANSSRKPTLIQQSE
ncbi:hypothetical protein EJ419_02175 [Alloscardovia theropitheci]|uniref:Uncharacterized protein n=1 Tax=Alloscardovia theropitheci TaxID=2496842 RepID=A0A4R0QQR2_9BIFI|nr:hypothetical protein [Alloscardovia theropitheci]TCD54663.1 hypothetical protein EJ419_02175 [Alloscardovia theropitheci]